MKFDIGKISEELSIPTDILSAVRTGTTELPNTDKDTNAQTIAELQHMISVSSDDNKVGYTAMLTDFIKGLTPETEVTTTASTETGVNANTEALVDPAPVESKADAEAVSKISEQRTNAAIKATGIQDGSWQVKVGPIRTGAKSARYKTVEGVTYEWRAKSSGSTSLGDVASDTYDSFNDQFSNMDALINNLNPFKD